ncbi:MAG: hypothetical protein SFY69_05100 [Planctomycetota bacterium]|nr:hypothetical protein [Planctomycetota bacterium]
MSSPLASAVGSRLATAGVSLALLAVAWYLLGLHPVLGSSVAGVIVVCTLAPPRYADLAAGVSFLALAGVLEFYFGFRVGAIVIALISVVELVRGLTTLRRTPA